MNYTNKKVEWSSCNFTYLFCLTIDFIKTKKIIIWQGIRDVSKMDRASYLSLAKKAGGTIESRSVRRTIRGEDKCTYHFWLENLILTTKKLERRVQKTVKFH